MAKLAVTGHEKVQETKDRIAVQQFQPQLGAFGVHRPSRSERLHKWSSPQRRSTAPALPSAETG